MHSTRKARKKSNFIIIPINDDCNIKIVEKDSITRIKLGKIIPETPLATPFTAGIFEDVYMEDMFTTDVFNELLMSK
jgi:hypothetical protein